MKQKNNKTDVVVIGGGAVGTATAYNLAKKGKKVILLEMRGLASGATGRCGGMVMHCYGRELNIDKTMYRLSITRANSEIMHEYEKTFEIDFEFRHTGSVDIAASEEEFEELGNLVKIQRSLGDDEIKLLDKKETLEIMPNLNPELIFGSRVRESDGNLNPFLLARAQALEAQKLGAEIRTNSKVKEILIKGDEVVGVSLSDEIIEAEYVISATNGWASLLTDDIEIIPVREAAMVTERLPDLPPQPFEMLLNGDFAYGCTQTKTGNYNLGGPAPPSYPDYDYFDETIYMEEVVKVMSYITRLFPDLKNVSVIRSWMGTMAFTPDGMPSIGNMPGIKGLYLAVGYPAGMSWAAISGKLIAESICDGTTSIPIDMLNPGRFIGKPKVKWPKPYDLSKCHECLIEGEA